MIFQQLIISALLLLSCNTGKLRIVADIPNSLKEVSAVEMTSNSDLMWVIEDAGNDNHLYALDDKGTVKKDLIVLNSENKDWEDLTSDSNGNIYIGDFGNNSRKRKDFVIYKVSNPEIAVDKVTAEAIAFKLPKELKSKDFEAFFLLDGYFYIFSKETKSSVVIKVPNQLGSHTAKIVTDFTLDAKEHKITSADVSDDGKTVVLLNHDKLWKITDFESDAFFKGTITEVDFGHDSQKEGICFMTNAKVLMTEESDGALGSNIYSLSID